MTLTDTQLGHFTFRLSLLWVCQRAIPSDVDRHTAGSFHLQVVAAVGVSESDTK